MGKLKLRRTIYIGIGGTGIKTILKVKENFHKSCNGNTPSMIVDITERIAAIANIKPDTIYKNATQVFIND